MTSAGVVGLGMSWLGVSRQGSAGSARRGLAWHVPAWPGAARLGSLGRACQGWVRHRSAGRGMAGEARHDGFWPVLARCGKAGTARRVMAGYGRARPVLVWRGPARYGDARQAGGLS